MIQEFLRPEFRYKLRDALDGSEGDMVKQASWIPTENCPRVQFDNQVLVESTVSASQTLNVLYTYLHFILQSYPHVGSCR